jgi:hypothetical protein
MSCECYQIGGRFIAEDPNCPIHGDDAQRRDRAIEAGRVSLEERIAELEERVRLLESNKDL